MRRQSQVRFEALQKTRSLNDRFGGAIDKAEAEGGEGKEEGNAKAKDEAHAHEGKAEAAADGPTKAKGRKPLFGMGTTDLNTKGDGALKKDGLASLVARYGGGGKGTAAEGGAPVVSLPLSRSERAWLRLVSLSCAFDVIAAPYFVYQGFVLNSDDRTMDPLAWQLAFGVTGIMVFFKVVQVILRMTQYVPVWLAFVVLLNAGLFYGAVRRWLIIYYGTFPCFKGNKDMFGMCYDGELLVGFTSATVYLTASCFFITEWSRREKKRLIAEGLLEADITLDHLFETAENKHKQHKRGDILFNLQAPMFMSKGFRTKKDQYADIAIHEDPNKALEELKAKQASQKDKDMAKIYKPSSALLAHMPPTMSGEAARRAARSDDEGFATRKGLLEELQELDSDHLASAAEAEKAEAEALGRANRIVPAGTIDPLGGR